MLRPTDVTLGPVFQERGGTPVRTRQMVKASILLIVVGALLIAPAVVLAQQAPPPAAPSEAPAAAPAAPAPPKIDSGDTAWMLTSSAWVLLLTAPGLALFYGGLVRRKTDLGRRKHGKRWRSPFPIGGGKTSLGLAFGPDR